MTDELARQLAELAAQHVGMTEVVEKETEILVSGRLPFEASSAGLPTITDGFDIEVSIAHDYPATLPTVIDTGGKIDASYEHLYANKSFCLGVPVEVRRIFLEQASLLGFVNRLVIPFLYSYCYWKQFGKYPFGDRPHGNAGIVQHYLDSLNVTDELRVLAAISFLFEYGYRGHHPCPCGSSQIVRKCHGDVLRDLQRCHTRQSLVQDFSAILSECGDKLVAEREQHKSLVRQVQRILRLVGLTPET